MFGFFDHFWCFFFFFFFVSELLWVLVSISDCYWMLVSVNEFLYVLVSAVKLKRLISLAFAGFGLKQIKLDGVAPLIADPPLLKLHQYY